MAHALQDESASIKLCRIAVVRGRGALLANLGKGGNTADIRSAVPRTLIFSDSPSQELRTDDPHLCERPEREVGLAARVLADEGCPCGAQRGGGESLPPTELQALAEQPGEAEAEAEAQALEGEG